MTIFGKGTLERRLLALPHDLEFRASARRDLAALDEFISRESPTIARDFVSGVVDRCETLREFPEIGRARPELGLGLRSLAFDRRIVVIYRLSGRRVEIVRVVYRGQELRMIFRPRG